MATTTRSRYHLSEEQLRFYDDNGYLILRNWITGPPTGGLIKART